MAFYPDIHHGRHMCDTTLGPCPGPKPEDYIVINRDTGHAEIETHYINHGNTWQSARKINIEVREYGKYIFISESSLKRFGKDVP